MVKKFTISISLFAALLSIFIIQSVTAQSTSVTFKNAKTALSGKLYLPNGKGPHPAVVFIHGSGPEKASNSSKRARFMAKQGFAALAFDKRGAGKSGGSPDSVSRFSFYTLAADVNAALLYLASREDIDTTKMGLIATSQGAWVAPIVADINHKVRFIINISASVSTVAEDRLFERSARLKMEGFSEAERAEVTAMQKLDQEVTRNVQAFAEFEKAWTKHKDKRWFPRVYGNAQMPLPAKHEYRLWYRTILDFNPIPRFEKQDLPALWLFGDPELDRFGPVALSIKRLNQLSETLGKKLHRNFL